MQDCEHGAEGLWNKNISGKIQIRQIFLVDVDFRAKTKYMGYIDHYFRSRQVPEAASLPEQSNFYESSTLNFRVGRTWGTAGFPPSLHP